MLENANKWLLFANKLGDTDVMLSKESSLDDLRIVDFTLFNLTCHNESAD